MGECGVKKAVALRPITSANAILPYIEELDKMCIRDRGDGIDQRGLDLL